MKEEKIRRRRRKKPLEKDFYSFHINIESNREVLNAYLNFALRLKKEEQERKKGRAKTVDRNNHFSSLLSKSEMREMRLRLACLWVKSSTTRTPAYLYIWTYNLRLYIHSTGGERKQTRLIYGEKTSPDAHNVAIYKKGGEWEEWRKERRQLDEDIKTACVIFLLFLHRPNRSTPDESAVVFTPSNSTAISSYLL